MAKVLMKGNEVIAETAIKAGCRSYFGYPITPQSELIAYMAKRLPKMDGMFLQAESEVAAINMVYGAACAGARVMTSSSSPGISLKQEGISYLVGAELPAVIVNIMRGGPGLGSIQPSQADYFQATKGGGHGDYKIPVYAPANLQEIVDLTYTAFDVADIYRTPVYILGDGMLGQMMEPVEFGNHVERALPPKDWATTGTRGDGKPKIINSLRLDPNDLEQHNLNLQAKYREIEEKEVKYEQYMTEDAEYIIVAFGIISRIAKTAISHARAAGLKVGMIRPITLWPFPVQPFAETKNQVNAYLTVEMSAGQMVEDVRLAVNGAKPVYFYGRMGGNVPTHEEIFNQVKEIAGGGK
jgi:2-oxoglutarate ferredoxin oxidoreductase subunit alpha